MSLLKNTGEKVDDYFGRIRESGYKPKTEYQGITRNDVEVLLKSIDKYSADICDTVWCLLNDEFPSLFTNSGTYSLADGASTAHIGGYIGILCRDGKRLDREGRDYWIKPLVDMGAIEQITFTDGQFVVGHLKAKSPNSCYRLSSSFVELLKNVGNDDFGTVLQRWISQESVNNRLSINLAITQDNKAALGDSAHKILIHDSIEIYAQHFLEGYIMVFVDADDGNRVTEKERRVLDSYGIKFGNLDDAWPDVILYNKATNSLWFIEAVTSDGEVDEHKMQGLHRICVNSSMTFGGATTTYPDWKLCASRQQKVRNLAIGSHVWIKADPEKHFKVQ